MSFLQNIIFMHLVILYYLHHVVKGLFLWRVENLVGMLISSFLSYFLNLLLSIWLYFLQLNKNDLLCCVSFQPTVMYLYLCKVHQQYQVLVAVTSTAEIVEDSLRIIKTKYCYTTYIRLFINRQVRMYVLCIRVLLLHHPLSPGARRYRYKYKYKF